MQAFIKQKTSKNSFVNQSDSLKGQVSPKLDIRKKSLPFEQHYWGNSTYFASTANTPVVPAQVLGPSEGLNSKLLKQSEAAAAL